MDSSCTRVSVEPPNINVEFNPCTALIAYGLMDMTLIIFATLRSSSQIHDIVLSSVNLEIGSGYFITYYLEA